MRKIHDIVKEIQAQLDGFKPQVAIILGSGLGGYADNIDTVCQIPFSQLHGFPKSSVQGHSGRFVFGRHKGKDIAILQGRVHYYEGYSMEDVVLPVRVLKVLGVQTLIITNAAGGVNPEFDKGDIMLIKDHISLFCPNPLIGINKEEIGTRFPDMTNAYSPHLLQLARDCAQKSQVDLKEGVYCYQTGPSYESAADVRAVRVLGADSVGMSTVPEVIAACHAGLNVCGFSYIANKAVGLTDENLTHQDVLQAFELSRDNFFALLNCMLEEI